MRKPKPFLRKLTDNGPLAVLAVTIALMVGIVVPASAQFFNFGGGGWNRPAPRPSQGGGGGWFGGDFFAPFQQQQPKRVMQDFSKAPPPDKRDPNFVPERRYSEAISRSTTSATRMVLETCSSNTRARLVFSRRLLSMMRSRS